MAYNLIFNLFKKIKSPANFVDKSQLLPIFDDVENVALYNSMVTGVTEGVYFDEVKIGKLRCEEMKVCDASKKRKC